MSHAQSLKYIMLATLRPTSTHTQTLKSISYISRPFLRSIPGTPIILITPSAVYAENRESVAQRQDARLTRNRSRFNSYRPHTFTFYGLTRTNPGFDPYAEHDFTQDLEFLHKN